MKTTVLRRRSRLVTFRMTAEEYEKLRAASAAQGARCLSDFARAALIRAAESSDTAHPEPTRLSELGWLDQRLLGIDASLARLALLKPPE